MNDTKDAKDDKTEGKGRKTLQLKKSVDAGQVRQRAASRGSTVVVQKKKRRLVNKEEVKPEEKGAPQTEARVEPEEDVKLTSAEQQRRAKVLEEARKREEEEKKQAAEEEARRKKEAEEEAARKAEEEKMAAEEAANAPGPEPEAAEAEPAKAEPEKADPETPAAPAAEDVPPPPRDDKPAARKPKPITAKQREEIELEEEERARRSRTAPKPTPRSEPRRRGKLTVSRALQDEGEERQRSLASYRRAQRKQRKSQGSQEERQKIKREVVLPEAITVGELANRMAERSADVIKELMKNGIMATVNETLDADTAELIVTEMGHTVKRVTEADVEIGLFGEEDDEKDLKSRPPVITIMGHVDHGKTSLLDALREADVVAGEAGGITQHIGAYQIQTEGGDKITFLDTPGHEAFTAMRARGAKVTDIVVLVVAADDGIMPQTIEAIQHAKAAEVPIIVAVNKVDKPEANPDRVKQELLQHEVIVEDMGGDVQCVEVSATKRQNLDALIEAIVLQSELLELKANPDRGAEGVVIEATLEKGRGSVATVLVTRGTLNVGDVFVAGAESGRVRALIDDHGEQVDEAGPSKPIEILGLNGTPTAGDDFAVVDSEARAREITDYRQRQLRDSQVGGPKVSLESMLDKLKEKEIVELPVVIKADVHGSAEAIAASLDKLATEEVAAKIVLSGVGGITESDVTLAEASGAPILGFNVRATGQARQLAEQQGVEIRYYSVIYELVDDVKAILSGMLAPEVRENILGYAEVKDVFPAGKGKAAGCLVTEGVVRSNAKARLLRDDVVVYEGQLQELRRFKDVVKEVNAGTECGMSFEGFNDIKAGDQIEVYEVEERERTL